MVILVDFDNTIAKSSERVFEIYQEESNDYSKSYNYDHGWDFEGLIPLSYMDRAISLFDKEIFFNKLRPMENAIEVLKRLSERHNIIIVTKANPEAVCSKSKWIKTNLPFVENVIYLEQKDFNKGLIKGDIIIDDKIECLLSGNWGYRILFGDYGWNKDTKGNPQCYFLRHTDWLEIESLVKNISDYEERVSADGN